MLLFNNNDNPNVSTEKNIARLEDYRNKIRALDGDIVNDIAPMLRGWEGQASRIYFSTINSFLPEQFRFENRTQHPALDVANAF